MVVLQLPISIQEYKSLNGLRLTYSEMTPSKRVLFLLLRDLLSLGWTVSSFSDSEISILPPNELDKDAVRKTMAHPRQEFLRLNEKWIQKTLPLARQHLAAGDAVLKSNIQPVIEICQTQKQHDLFRLFRYYWSSPYSDYVGRRIKLLIRDADLPNRPIIGIAALGSSIIHIESRDNWIGWNKETRTNRIVYMMDAYVIGALPPYNHLLGGKLISYILASNEVRELYRAKYRDVETLIKKRKADELVLIMTSSLYGKNSSQYNRLKYGTKVLYKPVGTTTGFGSLHISQQTFNEMRRLLETENKALPHRFGDGPNWRMRVIRSACKLLGINDENILLHSAPRGLYALPMAENALEFLRGEVETPVYYDRPMEKLSDYWKERWFQMRLEYTPAVEAVKRFHPNDFNLDYAFTSSPLSQFELEEIT